MATVFSLCCFGGKDGKAVTFTDAGDVVNLANHGLRNGAGVVFSNAGGALPTGLTAGTTYYSRKGADADKFTVHSSSAGAIAGTGQVTFSGTGTGTHTVKGAYYVGLADKSRWTTGGTERIYDSVGAWNTGRAGASAYDIEVLECAESFTDLRTTGLAISIPSAKNLITSLVNGVRGDGWHGGVYPDAVPSLTAGFELATATHLGSNFLTLARYRDEVDGIMINDYAASGTFNWIELTGGAARVRNCFVLGAMSGVAVNPAGPMCEFTNNVVAAFPTGVQGATTAGANVSFNLVTRCTTGFSCVSSTKGIYNDNISIGNTTNWSGTPTNIEAASGNAGLSGEAWQVGSGAFRLTVALGDFVNTSGSGSPRYDYHPAASTSPQVETGTFPYGSQQSDIADNVRPSYINATTDKFDAGPYEWDWGNGLAPVQSTLSIQGSVSLAGAEVRIYDLDASGNDMGTELAGTESNGASSYDYTGLAGNSIWVQILQSGYAEFGQQLTIPATDSVFSAVLQPDLNA